MELSPYYDLMSTIIHTTGERYTALDLYDKDHESDYYATYGHYGRTEFIEFTKRLGLIEIRSFRILDDFIGKEQKIISFIEKALLSKEAQQLSIKNLQEKLKRIR